MGASWGKVDVYKPLESVKVLRIELDVVVASTFDPQWRKCTWTALVDREAVSEVNHFVFSAVDNKHR